MHKILQHSHVLLMRYAQSCNQYFCIFHSVSNHSQQPCWQAAEKHKRSSGNPNVPYLPSTKLRVEKTGEHLLNIHLVVSLLQVHLDKTNTCCIRLHQCSESHVHEGYNVPFLFKEVLIQLHCCCCYSVTFNKGFTRNIKV